MPLLALKAGGFGSWARGGGAGLAVAPVRGGAGPGRGATPGPPAPPTPAPPTPSGATTAGSVTGARGNCAAAVANPPITSMVGSTGTIGSAGDRGMPAPTGGVPLRMPPPPLPVLLPLPGGRPGPGGVGQHHGHHIHPGCSSGSSASDARCCSTGGGSEVVGVSPCGVAAPVGVASLLGGVGVRVVPVPASGMPPRPSPTWDVGFGEFVLGVAVAVAVAVTEGPDGSEGTAGVPASVGSAGALPLSSP